MLTGQAKRDYQREYMRKRRSNKTCGRSPSVETIKAAGLTSDRSNATGLTKDGSNDAYFARIVRPEHAFAHGVILSKQPKGFTGELTKTRQTSQRGFNE